MRALGRDRHPAGAQAVEGEQPQALGHPRGYPEYNQLLMEIAGVGGARTDLWATRATRTQLLQT